MELSTIYQDTRLYKVSRPGAAGEKGHFSIPAAFKGVAILYEYEASAELPAELGDFLGKVISGGMKLEPASVLTANLCHTDTSLQKLAEEAGAKVVVIFGLQWLHSLKNANILKNEIVKLYGMKVLVTDQLETIQTNDAAKKAFWSELKKLF